MTQHGYYPRDLELPGYHAPVWRFESVLAVFFSVAILILRGVYVLTGRVNRLSTTERLIASWWALTGLIHMFVEGYVVATPDFYQDTKGNIFAEIWKEYAKADSRYASRDPFTMCMEFVTAFVEGPLCYVILYGMVSGGAWCFPLQIIVAVGQIYGTILYFGISYIEGDPYVRPEALYYWFYYVIINSIWLVVPGLIVAHAWRRMNSTIAGPSRVKPRGRPKRT